MSDPGHAAPGAGGFDREIGLKGLILFVAGLVALLVVAGVLMYLLSAGLREALLAADPPPPKLPEARRAYEIDGPRLQADPPADMATWRAQEEAALNRWAWTDESTGMATIPIERAMELLVEQRSQAPEAAGEEGGS